MILADNQVKRGHPGERVLSVDITSIRIWHYEDHYLSVGVRSCLQQQLHHFEVVLLGGDKQRCELVSVLCVRVAEEGLLGHDNVLQCVD